MKVEKFTQSSCSWWTGCRGLWGWTWGWGWQHLEDRIERTQISTVCIEVLRRKYGVLSKLYAKANVIREKWDPWNTEAQKEMGCATIKSYLQCKGASSMIAVGLFFYQNVICTFEKEIELKIAPKNLQMIIIWCITSNQERFKRTKLLFLFSVSVTCCTT